jgi:hypothetical protein
MFDVSSLSVGDNIGSVRYNSYYQSQVKLGKIVKINKWGHIEVEFQNGTMSFDKNGNERNTSKFSNSFSLISAENAQKIIAEMQKSRSDLEEYNFTIKTLEGIKNGYGYVAGKISSEDRNRIVKFLNSITEEENAA